MRLTLRKRGLLLAPLLPLTILLVATFGGCADSMLLNPTTKPLGAGRAKRIAVDHQGKAIEVFTARSSGAATVEPRAFVLEFTGNGTRAETICEYIANRWGGRPVEVWVMNYPGFGGSAGQAKLASIPIAALATYDAVAVAAKGRPIFVAGNSMGTTAALYVAAHRPVAGTIVQSPPPLRRLILQHYGWWNLWLLAGPVASQLPSELDSISNASQTTTPAIFILTGHDEVVPLSYQQLVFDAFRGPKREIDLPSGRHNAPVVGEQNAKLQEAIDWLWTKTFAQ